MSQMPNSEWDLMEERISRCLRLASVLRHDVECQALPMSAALLAIDRAHKHEQAADRMQAQLISRRGY